MFALAPSQTGLKSTSSDGLKRRSTLNKQNRHFTVLRLVHDTDFVMKPRTDDEKCKLSSLIDAGLPFFQYRCQVGEDTRSRENIPAPLPRFWSAQNTVINNEP
jgi:hypothetical protein